MMEKGIVIISKYGLSLRAEWSDAKKGYLSAARPAAGKVFNNLDGLKEFFSEFVHTELLKVAETARGKAMAFRMAYSKTEYLVALEKYGRCVKDGSTDTFLWKYVIDHFESCFTPEVVESYRKEMRLSVRRLSSKDGKSGRKEGKEVTEKKKNVLTNGSYEGTVLSMPGQKTKSGTELSDTIGSFGRKHGTGLPVEWHEIDTVRHLVVRIGRMTLPIPIKDIVSAHEIKRDVPTFSISCRDGFTYHLKLFGEWRLRTFNRNPDIRAKK